MGGRSNTGISAPKSTPFSKALGKALENLDYETLAQPLIEDIVIMAGKAAFEAAKANAPVGNPAKRSLGGSEDPHPGWLRDHIWHITEIDATEARALIGITKAEVPYVWRTIVGGRGHMANPYFDLARKAGFDAVKKFFRRMTAERFSAINRGER